MVFLLSLEPVLVSGFHKRSQSSSLKSGIAVVYLTSACVKLAVMPTQSMSAALRPDPSNRFTVRRRQTLIGLSALFVCANSVAQPAETSTLSDIQFCVQEQVVRPVHRSRSVASLFELCRQLLPSDEMTPVADVAADDSASPDDNDAVLLPSDELGRFFRPYKDNYIIFGLSLIHI